MMPDTVKNALSRTDWQLPQEVAEAIRNSGSGHFRDEVEERSFFGLSRIQQNRMVRDALFALYAAGEIEMMSREDRFVRLRVFRRAGR